MTMSIPPQNSGLQLVRETQGGVALPPSPGMILLYDIVTGADM